MRNLNKNIIGQQYFVDKDSIQFSEKKKNKIKFDLKCKNENSLLKVRIHILKMGVFRIILDDKLPKEGSSEEIKKRFKVN